MKKYFLILLSCGVLLSCQPPLEPLFQPQSGYFTQIDGMISRGPFSLKGAWLTSTDPMLKKSTQGVLNLGVQDLPGGWGYQGRFMEKGVLFLSAEIALNNPQGMWTLDLPTIFCAYRVYINGELKKEVGRVGDDRGLGYQEAVYPTQIYFPWIGNKTRIVLEVVNLSTPQGGIQGDLILSPMISGIKNRDLRIAENFFLAGAFLLVSIFHLFQFIVFPRRKADLYLSLFTLMALIRTLLTDQKVLTWLWNIPFEFQYDLEYGTVFALVHFLTFYLGALFPKFWKPKLVIPLLCANALLSFTLVFLNNYTFTQIFNYYLVIFLPLMGLNIGMILRAFREKVDGAGLLLGAVSLIVIVGVSDLLYSLGWHSLGSHFNLGFFGFLIFQFYLLASRSTKEQNAAKEAVKKLQETKIQQDVFVANTTHELKTPLHGVTGMAEALASSSSLPRNFPQSLSEIRTLGKEMDERLDALLTTSTEEN